MPDPDHEARISAPEARMDCRVDQVDERFDRLENEMRTGFAEMCVKLDQIAGGIQRIIDLLTDRIERDGR